MIKKVIFDLDNTLIMWKDEYNIDSLDETIKEYGLKNIDSVKISDIVGALETKHEILRKEDLLNDINQELNLNLNMDFIDTFLKKQSLYGPVNYEVIDTLKYLKKKYELVVITNYFTEVQSGRMKSAKIYEYFQNVYGGDIVRVKPDKDIFLKAVYPNKTEECIMIGDRLDTDIYPSLKLGLKAILFDYKKELPDGDKYVKIEKISDLKNIL